MAEAASESEINYKFRMMLINLGKHIKPAELEKIKYLLRDHIKTRARDGIATNEQLFEILEERHLISKDNLSEFKQWLHIACEGRRDVVEVVERFERERGEQATDGTPAAAPTFGTNRMYHSQESLLLDPQIQFLGENLGKEAKHFLRRLGLSESTIERIEYENKRDFREFIVKCLRTWVHDKQQHHHHHATNEMLREIISALQKERRNDLVKAIQELQ